MRIEPSVASRAREGSAKDFEAIVRAYEGPMYAFCLASTRDPEEAEDAVQEVFLKALLGLRDLREPERLESWLYAIARRELATRGRARAQSALRADLDPDELADPRAEAPRAEEKGTAVLGPLFAALSPGQALAVALRYGAGLSVRETALALGLPEPVAKSRIHEARDRMRRARAALRPAALAGGLPGFRIPIGLEERIMESVETLRLGARVLERMAIYDQARLAALAVKGERMDEDVLGAMGRIEGGTELVRRTEARLGLREFAAILGCSSRDTERRIVEELERVDPETAEAVKGGSFVFEDFSLFEEPALEAVVAELGAELFAQGLSACEARERGLVLGRLGSPTRARVDGLVASLAAPPSIARAAQEEAIALARRLDLEGRIEMLRGEEAGPLGCAVRLRAAAR